MKLKTKKTIKTISTQGSKEKRRLNSLIKVFGNDGLEFLD
jgi:hypothetical protein